jgi:hypothetical protein
MLAVTMTTIRPLVGSIAFALVACGGAAAPSHTGYPEGESAPWSRASKINLNDNLEASAEGELSYPKRTRAKWYVVELPAAGKLTARLSVEPTVKGSDVGVELLDAGFNVAADAVNDDDLGQPKKVREVKDARQGKTYVHIYALGRGDEVGYTLRLHFDPKPQVAGQAPDPQVEVPNNDRTGFPWTVPNLPQLAQIGKGGGPSPSVTPDEPKKPVAPVDTTPTKAARIDEFSNTGGGIRLILNKGTNAGLDAGMEGDVLSGGKPMPTGHFKIKSCRDEECEAIAPKATMDQIQANRSVLVKLSK